MSFEDMFHESNDVNIGKPYESDEDKRVANKSDVANKSIGYVSFNSGKDNNSYDYRNTDGSTSKDRQGRTSLRKGGKRKTRRSKRSRKSKRSKRSRRSKRSKRSRR